MDYFSQNPRTAKIVSIGYQGQFPEKALFDVCPLDQEMSIHSEHCPGITQKSVERSFEYNNLKNLGIVSADLSNDSIADYPSVVFLISKASPSELAIFLSTTPHPTTLRGIILIDKDEPGDVSKAFLKADDEECFTVDEIRNLIDYLKSSA